MSNAREFWWSADDAQQFREGFEEKRPDLVATFERNLKQSGADVSLDDALVQTAVALGIVTRCPDCGGLVLEVEGVRQYLQPN